MQAAAVLLKRSPGRQMPRLRLLKLLYIADREMLSVSGHVITGDLVVAMDRGPVLSRTYDLINGEAHRSQAEWERHFERTSYSVKLIADPGNSDLAIEEIEKIEEIFFKHEGMDEWDIVRETHGFREWKDNEPPAGSSLPIPFEDTLKAVGMSEWKDDLVASTNAAEELEQLLLSAGG